MGEEIDLSGIKKGMIVPNYKKMCELLGEKVKGGKGKICQLKRWDRYFEYVREGNSFKILKVFESPESNAPLKSSRSGFVKCIEPVLVDHIIRNGKGKSISVVKRDLFAVAGLVNENYISIGKIGDLYGDVTGAEIEEKTGKDLVLPNGTVIGCEYVYWMKYKVEKKFYGIIDSSLKSMIKRDVITVAQEYVIIYVNNFGEKCRRIANKEEIGIINSAEKDILKKMGITRLAGVQISGRTREFYELVNDLLRKEQDWQSVFRRMVITLNGEHIVGGKIRESSALALKRRVNKRILSYIRGEIAKDREIYADGKYPYNPNSWKSKVLNKVVESDDFPDIEEKIIDYIVRL